MFSVSSADIENIAPIYGTAWANNSYGEQLPALAIDGDLTTGWNAGDQGYHWAPQWLVIDLGNQYPVEEITLVGISSSEENPYVGYGNVYCLLTSSDGENWVQVVNDSWVQHYDPSFYSDTWTLPGDDLVRYVKYEVVGGLHWATINEIAVLADLSAIVVPAPGAALLGAIGLSYATSVLRRRKR